MSQPSSSGMGLHLEVLGIKPESTKAPDHAAETGNKLLQELRIVDESTSPELTIRNVLAATDSYTMLNCLALTLCYSTGIIAYLVPTAMIPFMVNTLSRPELASWISSASTVATASILLPMSNLTDIIGRRYALLFGCAMGVVGSLVTGLAQKTNMTIVGQALTGCSIGFVFISAASLAEIVPAFTRPFWGTFQHTSGTIGQVLGPIYGGAFIRARPDGWRWVFYINAILYGFSFILILALYRPKSRVKALGLTNRQVAKNFDYLGLALFAGGTTAFLCGLSWGGDKRYGWKSAHAIVPTTVGLAALVLCFPLYEAYVSRYPLVNRSLFKYRNFNVLNVQTFVTGFAEFSINVYFPQLLLAFWEQDPLLLGVDRMTLSGTLALSQTFSGILLQRTGHYKRAYIFYAFCLVLGPAIFAVLRPNQPIGVPLGLSTITGIGIGGATQLGLLVIQYSVPQQHLGLSTGSLNTVRSFGGAVGVAVYNSILSSQQNANLPKAVATAALHAGAGTNDVHAIVAATAAQSHPALVQAAHGNTAIINAALAAYKTTVMNSYRLVFLVTIPFGLLSLAMCLLLREVKQYLTNETVFGVRRTERQDVEGIEHTETPLKEP